MVKRFVFILAACLAGACGGGSKDGGVVSVRDVADKLGCSATVDPAEDRELFIADSGECNFIGDTVTINRFSNNKTRDQWIDFAKSFGIGRFVVIDRGVLFGEEQRTADRIRDKVGGDIRTD